MPSMGPWRGVGQIEGGYAASTGASSTPIWLVASMGTCGYALDNASCQSVIAAIKRELIDRQFRPMGAAARRAVFDNPRCPEVCARATLRFAASARSKTNPTMSLGTEEPAAA